MREANYKMSRVLSSLPLIKKCCTTVLISIMLSLMQKCKKCICIKTVCCSKKIIALKAF